MTTQICACLTLIVYEKRESVATNNAFCQHNKTCIICLISIMFTRVMFTQNAFTNNQGLCNTLGNSLTVKWTKALGNKTTT